MGNGMLNILRRLPFERPGYTILLRRCPLSGTVQPSDIVHLSNKVQASDKVRSYSY